MTLFYICLVVFHRGVVWYGTPWPSGLKTICLFRWKTIDFSGKCLLLLWPSQRSNRSGWCMLSRSSLDVFTLMIKIFQTQSWQFVPPSKVTNVKNFYDPGNLVNKIKVKLMTCKKGLVIMHLKYKYQVSTSNSSWFMDICLSFSYNWKIQLWPIKCRNEGTVT